jgi:hypothetical protein
MTGLLKSISCAIPQAANRLVAGRVDAAKVKLATLKIGEAQACAFTSKQTNDTTRWKHNAGWNRMISKLKKKTRNGGAFAAALRAKCLVSLPLGFVKPRLVD